MRKYIIIPVAVWFITAKALSQSADSTVLFTKGEKFEKVTTAKTTRTWQRKKHSLIVNYNSMITSSFIVDHAGGGYIISKSIDRINNTITSNNGESNFASEITDTSSVIQKSLSRIIGKMLLISINKDGVVTSVDNAVRHDSISQVVHAFTGLSDTSVIDHVIELVSPSRFKNKPLKTNWSDTLSFSGRKEIITYTIDSFYNAIVRISFAGKIIRQSTKNTDGYIVKKEALTNLNGTMEVNSATGIILKRTTGKDMTGTVIDNNSSVLVAEHTYIVETVRRK